MNPEVIDASKGPCVVRGFLYGADIVLDKCNDVGQDFYYMDNGYIVDKKRYSRLTKNWWFITDLKDNKTKEDENRIRKYRDNVLKSIRPWKTSGSYILICPSSTLLEGRMLGADRAEDQWLNETVETIKKHTDRPIKIRRKLVHKAGQNKKLNPVSLEKDLKGAHACVTLGSVCAIDALRLGVPSFSDPKSMVQACSSHDFSAIENPIYPDNRELLFENLLLNQFNFDEFANGTAWEYVTRNA